MGNLPQGVPAAARLFARGRLCGEDKIASFTILTLSDDAIVAYRLRAMGWGSRARARGRLPHPQARLTPSPIQIAVEISSTAISTPISTVLDTRLRTVLARLEGPNLRSGCSQSVLISLEANRPKSRGI